MPFTDSAPPAGAVESFVKVSAPAACVFPATSAPVRFSVGELVVPCAQLNVLESNGPPAGVDTVEGVCVQPALPPASAAVWEEAGPDSPSETEFVIRKLPPPTTEPR